MAQSVIKDASPSMSSVGMWIWQSVVCVLLVHHILWKLQDFFQSGCSVDIWYLEIIYWNKNDILHPCPLIRIELGGLHGWIIQVNSVKPPIKSVRWPLKAFAEIKCFVKQNILQCIIKVIFSDVPKNVQISKPWTNYQCCDAKMFADVLAWVVLK